MIPNLQTLSILRGADPAKPLSMACSFTEETVEGHEVKGPSFKRAPEGRKEDRGVVRDISPFRFARNQKRSYYSQEGRGECVHD